MMKGNTLLILLAIATLSLTACGKEPAETVVEETSVEETTPVETDTENPESEMDSKIKEAVAELDALLENGEITQEDYDREVESITQLIKAMYSVSPDELDLSEDYLPDNLKDIENKTEEEIEEIFQEIEKENYEKFVEEQQKIEQETSQPDNSTTGNQSQEEPEDGESTIDWGDLFTEEELKAQEESNKNALEFAENFNPSPEEVEDFIKNFN